MLYYICIESIEPTGFVKGTKLPDYVEIYYHSEWAYVVVVSCVWNSKFKKYMTSIAFECTLSELHIPVINYLYSINI